MKYICFILAWIPFCFLNAQSTLKTIAWNADSLGNHRAEIFFFGSGSIARTELSWRRRDAHPESKRLIVVDSATGKKIVNVHSVIQNPEKLLIYFEPISGKGTYYIYFLPSKNTGSANYPRATYWPPEQTATVPWLQSISSQKKNNARLLRMAAIDSFNQFSTMEMIATAAETKEWVAKSKRGDYLVVPESRDFPIRMFHQIPLRWIQRGPVKDFKEKVYSGESFSFQLGVYALQNLEKISIEFTDLKDGHGNRIVAQSMSCLNIDGIDYKGLPFTKEVNIPQGHIQPLWCLVPIPKPIPAGIYTGRVTVRTKNTPPTTIPIQLQIVKESKTADELDLPWKQTRLHWLNDTLAQENTVIEPYTALVLKQQTISLLGRELVIDSSGFPAQINTFFTEAMTGFQKQANPILTEPIHFHFMVANGPELKLHPGPIHFTKIAPGTISWQNTLEHPDLDVRVQASLEFDGFVSYSVKLTALKDIHFKNISMHIPFTHQASKYLMGLGEKGRLRPDSLNWKWAVDQKNQDGAWLGNVNAGLQFSLRDEQYVRPLNTNFYLQKPLRLPSSWGNDSKGGIHMVPKGQAILVDNYSGERTLRKGDTLYFNFNLLITPFHTLQTDFQWATRFYHKYDSIQKIKNLGATIINIHHGNAINPWINYPFIEWRKMKAYIDQAHEAGLKVKIYNTVRELSNHAYETFPLRSLGQEVYAPGKGGGYSWLQEHLDSNYIAAWFVPEVKDAAIVNSGLSRWHNYYVAGMDWLTQHVGIDGIYLDDVAFDRITMKRIKRVLTRNGHPGIIDLHSANQFNKSDGFINSANLYMEHFPYLNRLWFGEYFDYENNSPDYFLTEISGIPFGLMGEMLQDGGNAWRGMIYGMTSRMPWTESADPTGLWKFWDAFGMKGTEMIGYWVANSPVRSNMDNLKITVYKKPGKLVLAIASWHDSDAELRLDIDWKALGINPATARLTAPAIKNFQEARSFLPADAIPVKKNKGWLLVLE